MKSVRLWMMCLALLIGAMSCRAHVRGTAVGHAPTLVWIDGFWVVEGHHEPVFYSSHYYWRFHAGIWYRSHSHTDGWEQTDEVPAEIKSVDEPGKYVGYHGPTDAKRSDGPPDKAGGPPDHAPAHGVHGTQPGHNKDGDGPGHSGDDHGKSGDDHGKPDKDDKGKPDKADKDDKGKSGDDKAKGKSGEDHGDKDGGSGDKGKGKGKGGK